MAEKIVCTNTKARFNYNILNSFEAGIELKGTEVKALRESKASLNESFAHIDRGEVFLYNCNISPYSHGNIYNVDPARKRKLLLHKNEIKRLQVDLTQKGLTLIPLKIYFKEGIAKMELALCKGKKLFDKRETIKKRDQERETKRYLK